jgi:hypothetical protein
MALTNLSFLTGTFQIRGGQRRAKLTFAADPTDVTERLKSELSVSVIRFTRRQTNHFGVSEAIGAALVSRRSHEAGRHPFVARRVLVLSERVGPTIPAQQLLPGDPAQQR